MRDLQPLLAPVIEALKKRRPVLAGTSLADRLEAVISAIENILDRLPLDMNLWPVGLAELISRLIEEAEELIQAIDRYEYTLRAGTTLEQEQAFALVEEGLLSLEQTIRNVEIALRIRRRIAPGPF